MIEVSGISISLDAMLPGKEASQKKEIARALGIAPVEVRSYTLLRRSVDARRKSNVHFTTTFACELAGSLERRFLQKAPKGLHVKQAASYAPLTYPDCSQAKATVLVVGLGPAGLFAALYLSRCGIRPIVVERGFDVETRARDVERFEQTGMLNPHSNIQFGEGGAGAFSDGKLTTNIKSPYARHVLHWFVDVGAPKGILVESHPHLGSDKLPDLVAIMRNEIITRGGEVRFGTRLLDWRFSDNQARSVSSVTLEEVETGHTYEQPVSHVILACGHSARDVFELCKKTGFAMEQKPFSVGVRIEHPQSVINEAQWGKAAHHPALGSAEYKLAVHLSSGRSVYTFCMCPGGSVVAAASEEGGVVTNGMSRFARAEENANAALLVNVDPQDFGSEDVLAGVQLQRRIEQAAFAMAKKYGAAPYQAPCQSVGEFLAQQSVCQSDTSCKDVCQRSANRQSSRQSSFDRTVHPTYGRGTFEAPLSDCLPGFVVDALAEALPYLGKKLAHFDDPDAMMTAPETRSSSPVRIKRGKNLQAFWARNSDISEGLSNSLGLNNPLPQDKYCDKVINERDGMLQGESEHGKRDEFANGEVSGSGIYPCGEGPGFAGGIMSAACDGLRVACSIAKTLHCN